VSRFTLTTRERGSDSPEGTQVIIGGGKILEVKAAGSAPGTTVEVRQLFFNLPARRKFLRSEETESAHVQHYLTLAALAFPEVAFTFQKDSRSVWQLPAVKAGTDAPGRLAALRERLTALSGAEQKLLPVDFSTEFQTSPDPDEPGSVPELRHTGHLRLWGFIGAPGVSRATREDQHLFVNRRPVENRGLNFALLEGYHTALMKGRYPVCCLFLEIDPGAVDVNIHPAKREVKFHREADVRRFVAQAVRQTLIEFHSPQTAGGHEAGVWRQETGAGRLDGRDQGPGPRASTQSIEQGSLPNLPAGLRTGAGEHSIRPHAQPPLQMGFSPRPGASTPAHRSDSVPDPTTTSSGSALTIEPPLAEKQSPGPVAPSRAPSSPPAAVPLLSVPLRLVGVIGKLYVVLESDRGLVLLDQHAAHERILFEQMLNRLEHNDQAPSQKLLLPETVELSARDANFVRDQMPVLTRLGVGLSEFGERTFLLDALPPFVRAPDPRRFMVELVDELRAAGQEVNSLRLGEKVVAKTVCRHAVKANDPLAGPELESLIEDLRHCAMPYTCPHGRPTLIEMNFRELEKKFGRTQ
jgi:DNA mismatch repair protein MutL